MTLMETDYAAGRTFCHNVKGAGRQSRGHLTYGNTTVADWCCPMIVWDNDTVADFAEQPKETIGD